MKIIKLNKTGDTIVEALIVIAVLALSVGIAYNVAIRSSVTITVARERDQALQLAQTQIESLRAYYGLHVAEPTFNGTSTSCFDVSVGTPPPATCTSGIFSVVVSQASGTDGLIYTIQVTWAHELVGGPKNNVTVYYQVGT
jgi:type II secretory pathway pseudopilin PulG